MRVLFVAAEPREFAGLLPFCGRVRRAQLPVQWAREAELNGVPVMLVTNGAGAERAAAAVRAAPRPDAVVSTGFCGAVDPGLGIGDIFAAEEVVGLERCFRTCLPRAKTCPATGRLATVGRVLASPAEKAALHSRGAAAVDMESAGVALEAESLNVPLICVRSVTDLANENLRNDFNGALRSDGHFDTIYLLRAAAGDPVSLLPELLRLSRRSRVAARALGDFFADCRF